MPTEQESADVKKLLGELTERVTASPPSGLLVLEFRDGHLGLGFTDNLQPFAEVLREMFKLADEIGRGGAKSTEGDARPGDEA